METFWQILGQLAVFGSGAVIGGCVVVYAQTRALRRFGERMQKKIEDLQGMSNVRVYDVDAEQ